MGNIFNLVIIGGGPGGVAAGIYAARKKIKTLLITDNFGGQSLVSNKIENWIGEINISGVDLALKLEKHLKNYEKEIEILEGDLVKNVIEENDLLKVLTENNKVFYTRTILVCSGSRRKKLNVLGEKEFEGKGIFYCATCDAPLMKDKIVAVIGGGNAGLEAVVDLLNYASKIYLLVRSNELKGDLITQEKVKTSEKVEIIYNMNVLEFFGDNFLKGLKYLDLKTNNEKIINVDGVFVEIGSEPNSDFIKNLVNLNEKKEIEVDFKTLKTSHNKIWAAGDVSNVLYKQNNISVGDSIKAVLNIYDYLKLNKFM